MATQPVIAFVQRTPLLMGNDHKVNMKMDYMTVQADYGSFIICFFFPSHTQLAVSLLMEREPFSVFLYVEFLSVRKYLLNVCQRAE